MRALRTYSIRLFFGWAILFFGMTTAQAGNGGGGGSQVKAVAVLDGSQHQIRPDSTITVVDSSFFDPSLSGLLTNKSYTVQNAVTVMINEASPLYMHSQWTATLKLFISSTDSAGNVDTMTRIFTVGYDSVGTYNSRISYAFQGGHKVTVKVVSDSTNATGWDPMTVLLVENQLSTRPAFAFNCQTTINTISVNPIPDSADELPVSWNAVLGADQYDLEWTYIYDSALNNYKTGSNYNPTAIFRNNATRVTVTGTSYNIPMIYDDHGTLFIRVRPVMLGTAGAVTNAIWSSDASPAIMGSYAFNGHERPLNWQSNISYAEEGKRKVVVQYYDGSLRSRQTVTKDNTTNTTIVGETYYDYQGRPSIQVMPAPTLNNVIGYTAGFNVSLNSPDYNQSNYDTLTTVGYCDAHADPMGDSSGASQYYSPYNPQANQGLNQFIPNAEHYPFTETEYTPDNTGRISRQGGVGPNHQLGSGHETKYYYGTPDQAELDALFGTEVGDKSHYFKNMVRDANGQYSVSYVDMHGRTIATALSGAQPQGMSPLPSNNVRTLTETLADPSTASVRGLNMISQKALVVSQADTYNFSYSLLPDTLLQDNCQNQNICYTCRYDLTVTITDNCNNNAFGGQPYVVSKHNFSLATLANSTLDTAMNFTFSVPLPEGSYVVTKQLTINQDAYNYYRDSIYMPNNTCTSLSQLLTQQKSVIASKLTSCTASCSDCMANVGTFATFLASYNQALGLSATDTTYKTEATAAFQSALSACAAVCQTSNDVNDITNGMLQDMTPPFGQYADSVFADDYDKYSIFYIQKSSSGPNDTGYVPLFKLPEIVYHDANGKPDSVYDAKSGLMVAPNMLTKEEFTANFRPSWANDLLPYHPDYLRLKVMITDSAGYNYDRKMAAADTYQMAKDSGYLNPSNYSGFVSATGIPTVGSGDPLLAGNTNVKNDVQGAMTSYQNLQRPNKTMTMWGLAVSMVKCANSTNNSCVTNYTTDATYAYGFNDPSLCTADKDMAWRIFRQLYLQKKQDFVYKDLLASPSGKTANSRQYTSTPKISSLTPVHTSAFTQLSDQLSQQDGPLKYLSNINGTTAASNAQANVQDSLNAFYSLNVNAYAQQWYQQLTSSCTLYNPTDVQQTLIPALKALCLQATDVDHPYGASTLSSGATPYTFEGQPCTSFTQIINLYNQSKGITDQVHCNAELINSPLPYDNQPVYAAKPEYGRPSDCECSIITGLFNQYTVSHFGDTSFSAYLLRTQHVTMTSSDLNTLLGMCDNTTNSLSCQNNEQPIYLPPVMQCHAGQTCSSCQAIDSLYAAFKVAYPGILPTDSSDADTAQAIKNQLFQNYMNNRLGYNLQFWQYLQFMDTCAAHAADTVTSTNCSPITIAQIFKSGAGSTDNMISICSTADGGYALAGYKGILGQLDTAYLMRYNSAGQIQWANTYITTGGSNFWKVRATSDGGFIAAGADFTAGGALVVKTNADGTTAWQRTISFVNDAAADQAFDIIQTSDGGYAVVGDQGIGYPFRGPARILCMKLDNSGNVLWAQGFGDISGQKGNDGYAVGENNDTLIVLGRQTSNSVGGVQGVVLKVDEPTGHLLNSISIKDSSMVPGSSSWFGLQVFEITTTSTGYHLSDYVSDGGQGYNGRYGFVDIGFDNSLKKASRIGVPPGNTVDDIAAGGMVPTADGGWLCGETTGTTTHISLVKLDSSAHVLWSRESMLPGTQTFGYSVQNPDGTYAALGTDGGVAMIANLSSTGSTGCYDSVVAIGTDSPSIKISVVSQVTTTLTPSISGTSATVTSLVTSANAITCQGNTNCYVAYNGPLLCGKSDPLLTPTVTEVTNCSDSTFFTVSTATSLFNNYTDSLTGDFEKRYLAKCMNAYRHETFTVTHNVAEYHYTLYYYDQAGNLVKTVPPAGVQQITDTNWIKQVDAARAAGTSLTPYHTLITSYRYNTLNQVIAQRTPDGGGSQFWYDRLGRLAVSQNARQTPGNQYSFTQYDTIGRIIDVGQLRSTTAISNDVSRSQNSLSTWLTNAMPTANQITVTTYDTVNGLISNELVQQNTRNRVSYTNLYDTATDMANGTPNAAASTYYSYDILGNVDTLVQDYGSADKTRFPDVNNIMNSTQNRFKKIAYDFDLVSGKVNQVSYQHGYADGFYHAYQYDAENRITNVQSSTDSVNWDNDAFYSYYKHGPLARTVLGQQQVQGINYVYTLQGWLKAINPDPYTGGGFTLQPDSTGNVVANNAYSLLLNYFSGDYKPISNVAGPDNGVYGALGADSMPLYNGNISSMGVNIKKLNSPLLYSYQYDQLNRLTHMDAWKRSGTAWSGLTASTDYQENVTYDPNGNILTYHRNRETAGSGNQMDQLQYNYISGTNQLDHIYDTVTASSNAGDIASQSAGNYKYDSLGELVGDAASNITNITWTVYGKIASITKSTDTVIKYTYDPAGNRISKTVTHAGSSTVTWYVRDAQGNILSVYTYGDPSINGGSLAQTELDIYGSSRLGVWKRVVPVSPLDSTTHNSFSGDSITFTRGNKLFELTNHLGNVLATISDKRYGVSTDDSTVVYYNPEVVSANDYYPFGMMQYARNYTEPNVGNYRYGFNGKENDNEVKGTGDQIDYGMRIYDPRVGRFMSVDPLTKKYPELTPYQYASNDPSALVDIDGLEGGLYLGGMNESDAEKVYPRVAEVGQKVVNFIVEKHQQGVNNVRIAEGARQTAIGQGRSDGDGINWLTKGLVYLAPWWNAAAPLSHANDGSVLMTGKNLDNSDASTLDYAAAGAGLFLPIAGSELKKGGSALIEGVIKVFRNGNEIEEAAYKIGKYGFKGTKEYNSIVKAIKSGGNIVANTKEEALKFLKESFPGIADETGKAASKFGYRIDEFVDEAKEGLKQGHQGWHINYYDKENKVKGTILVDEVQKPKK